MITISMSLRVICYKQRDVRVKDNKGRAKACDANDRQEGSKDEDLGHDEEEQHGRDGACKPECNKKLLPVGCWNWSEPDVLIKLAILP